MARSALLVGATGLIGGSLLELLLTDDAYGTVNVLSRRRLKFDEPKLHQMNLHFDDLEQAESLMSVQDIFCCLGTTIKKAGSQQSFRKVDFDYPARLAQLGLKHGVEQFLIVTSVGANPNSHLFYIRVKGEVERAITGHPFRSVHIFRPSILDGGHAEYRFGERVGLSVMKALSFLAVGGFRKYRPINPESVARAMIAAAKAGAQGTSVYESDMIERMGTFE